MRDEKLFESSFSERLKKAKASVLETINHIQNIKKPEDLDGARIASIMSCHKLLPVTLGYDEKTYKEYKPNEYTIFLPITGGGSSEVITCKPSECRSDLPNAVVDNRKVKFKIYAKDMEIFADKLDQILESIEFHVQCCNEDAREYNESLSEIEDMCKKRQNEMKARDKKFEELGISEEPKHISQGRLSGNWQ